MITCADARGQFALLLYGELSFDEEEQVETHLDSCEGCRVALDRERVLHASFDQVAVEPTASLLRECRENLMDALPAHPAAAGEARRWWDWSPRLTWLTPVGAMAMLAMGFFGARLAPSFGQFNGMSVADPGMSRVRYVQPTSDGRVQVVLDETRQRTITGGVDDGNIRALLLSAMRDPSDPGLRAETVEILNGRAQSEEIRLALLNALRQDQNAGVRLKAMQGLKAYTQQADVQGALAQVLLSDTNPGVRTQAIDLLTQKPGQDLDRQVIGQLQELMSREDNAYVRQRCLRVLESLNASPEIY